MCNYSHHIIYQLPKFINPREMNTSNVIDLSEQDASEQRGCRSSQNSDRNPIVLQSSNQQQPPQAQNNEIQSQLVISRRAESQQAKKRRIQSALQRYKQIQEQEEKERQELKMNEGNKNGFPSKHKNVQMRKEYQFLKRQFELHSYLSHEMLKKVKEDLDTLHSTYRMEKSIDNSTMESQSIRFEQRKKLTRAIRLAIQEIIHRVKYQDQTSAQATIFASQDYLKFSYQTAAEIETIFFNKLYNTKAERKKGDLYLRQVKLVLIQFSNKYNMQFRRDIINKITNLQHLAFATEEELTCAEAKADEAEKLKIFLRQNEKIDENKALDAERQEELPLDAIPSINSFISIKSVTDLYNEKKQAASQAKARQKQKMLSKTKAICKTAHRVTSQIIQKMRERTAKLKSFASNSSLLVELEDWNQILG